MAPTVQDHSATLEQKVNKESPHTATTVISEIEGHCEDKEVGQYFEINTSEMQRMSQDRLKS